MGILSRLLAYLAPSRTAPAPRSEPRGPAADGIAEERMPTAGALRLAYAARPDGRLDAGEVVWGWVPFAEDPTQGKDRPLLILAPAPAGRMYAMKLTSRRPDRPDDHIAIGSGAWDRAGRPSWVDIDQIYTVPPAAVRREGAAVDAATYHAVAAELSRRFGWRAAR